MEIKRKAEEQKHKYPVKLKKKLEETKENSKTVSDHYDKKLDKGLKEREKSEILGLRNFNNWIKSVLIQKYIQTGDKVLDLGCGKGGDLMKYENKKILSLVGCDVSKGTFMTKIESLKDFQNRYNERKCNFPVTLYLGIHIALNLKIKKTNIYQDNM